MSDSPFVPPVAPIAQDPKFAEDERDLMALALTEPRSRNGTCAHHVAGVELVTDAEGFVYWLESETLVVADLHLEKGSSFARRGQMLPPYDTHATLKRLAKCIEIWRPARVIALGDSFHDADAAERLPLPAAELLKSIMNNRDWIWITGNHDPEPPKDLGGEMMNEFREGGLIFRHEPQKEDCQGELAGHLHPKARIVLRGRSIRRSCFIADENRMILPSFGAYTGGLNVLDPAFDGLFEDRKYHALMRGDGQVYRIKGRDLR